MTTPICKFRSKMDSFLKMLQKELTEMEQMKELEKFRLTFDLGMRSNPQGTVNLIMNYMAPYADEILRGDEEYFLKEYIDPTGSHASLLDKVRSWWPKLSLECREDVKNAFKLFLMLGTLATQNCQTLAIINSYRDADNPLVF